MRNGRCCSFLCVNLLAATFCSAPILAEEPADQALARDAGKILERYCYRCHGKDGSAEGKMNYVIDHAKLIERRKIVPGNSEKSRVFEQISEGLMPPDGEEPRPSDAEVLLLKRWIDAGAPAFSRARKERSFVSDSEALRYILDDLRAIQATDRRFARYFVSTHLYNAGVSDADLELGRLALVKLINSLSWGPRIVVPEPIDPAGNIVRVDIRDLRWETATWERIIAANPYRVIHSDPKLAELYTATLSKLPYVRADWFVHAAARPPLYHDVLELPELARQLEQRLQVDVAQGIRQALAARAGFNDSGVSQHNRMIERHESAFGAYWISYDFAGSSGAKNLFSRPLGPRSVDRSINSFDHDGGEIIFNLPNGLQAYLLVDEKGQRIDKGPTAIVSDPKRPDRAVENGISCMSCHARGMIAKDDQIRPHVEKNPAAFKDLGERDTILALYRPHDEFRALLKEDADRFRRALERCGIGEDQTEPISAVSARFEAELDLVIAAAEVGLQTEDFLQRLNQSRVLPRKLGTLNVPGGTIKRETFIAAFFDVVRELELGEPFVIRDLPSAATAGRRNEDDFSDAPGRASIATVPRGPARPNAGPQPLRLGDGSSPRFEAAAREQTGKAATAGRSSGKSEIRPPDFEKCAQILERSAVQVHTDRRIGAGFAVDDGTAIVTTNQVIEQASKIEIETIEGGRQEAEVLLSIPDRDLAILRILEPLKPLLLAGEDQFMFQTPVMLFDRGADKALIKSTGVLTALFQGSGGQASPLARDLASDTLVLGTDASVAQAHAGAVLATPDGLVVGVMRNGDAAVHVSHIKDGLAKALPNFKPTKARLSGVERIRLERMRRTIALKQLEAQDRRRSASTIDTTAMGMFINSFNQFMPRVP